MTVMSEEEFLRRSIRKAVSNTVETIFRTREFSKRFLGRKDSKQIDKEVELATEKVTDLLIQKLKQEKLLGKDVTQQHFSEIYKAALDEYFGSVNPDRSQVQAK